MRRPEILIVFITIFLMDGMEDEQEDRSNISSQDLQNLQHTISRFVSEIETSPDDMLPRLAPVLHGLGSDDPHKRCGYAIVLSAILDRFCGVLSESGALGFLSGFHFVQANSLKKSRLQTGVIAKAVALLAFARAGVISSDEALLWIVQFYADISASHRMLSAFLFLAMAEIVMLSDFRLLPDCASRITSNLDGFIFWLRVSQTAPASVRPMFPPQFQKPTPYNSMTAQSLQKTYVATKQPWNSQVWKLILDSASDHDLFIFWPQIFEQQMQIADAPGGMAIVYIVRGCLPVLRPSQFHVVICPAFVKMLNSFLQQLMLQEPVLDFLTHILSLASHRVLLFAQSFKYIDYGVAFEFHRSLFEQCTTAELLMLFLDMTAFGDNDEIELKNRFQSKRTTKEFVASFRLAALRAMLIASAHHPSPPLSAEIFDYILKNCPDSMSALVRDLVQFDLNRVDEAATLGVLLGDDSVSHFESCFRLYSMCTGVSSSPSLDTVVPPEISGVPSPSFITLAIQKADKPGLIAHAFRVHLRTVMSMIPTESLGQFLVDFVPTPEAFSVGTVEMFRVAVENCVFSLNLLVPLFQVFCRTITNIGLSMARAVQGLINDAITLDPGNFALPTIVKGLFVAMSELSNSVMTAHERIIVQTFNQCLSTVITKSLPLPAVFIKCIKRELEMAMADFAFKKSPHFTEDIFTEFLALPEGIPQILFPIVLRNIPNVKRVHRRMMLFSIVTKLLGLPKGLEVLQSKGNEFNKAVLALLNEDYQQNKDNEGRFMKSLVTIKRWLEMIEKKRRICVHVNVGDMKKRLITISSQSKDPIQAYTRQILVNLQKIEGQVHPKDRVFI
jgi:hypothetical protein